MIAKGCYLTGNIEKYGSGFIRIRKALREYPEVKFEVSEFAGGVMAAFTQTQGASNSGVNVGINNLFNYIQSHSCQRTGEMAAEFKLTKRTIGRWLK